MNGHCGKAWRSSPSASPTAQRGNVTGATSLLRSASARLAHADRPGRHGIDVAGVVDFADALIDDLAAGVQIPPERLRVRLVVVGPDRR